LPNDAVFSDEIPTFDPLLDGEEDEPGDERPARKRSPKNPTPVGRNEFMI
jgi:hypothetical protein